MHDLTVGQDILIEAARDMVWHALTDPEQLEQWYAPGCRWEILTLQPGATVKFYNTETDIQSAKILVSEFPQEFSLRWQWDALQPEAVLVNTFLLTEAADGTHVTAIQTGYESLPDKVRSQQLQDDSGAYGTIVQNLKAYVEGLESKRS